MDGRTEGRALSAFLDLARIPNSYNLATDLNTFDLAFGDRLAKAVSDLGVLPTIHISAHGNKHEIELTNGERVSWSELAKRFCLSACFGLTANKMLLETVSALPMKTLVASSGKVGWHEAAVGYATFYNHFLKLGKSIEESVTAMKAASGCDDFQGTDSKELRSKIELLRAIPQEMLEAALQLLRQKGTVSKETSDQIARLST